MNYVFTLIDKANLFLIGMVVLIFSSCHVARFFYWNYADVNDFKKFPSQTIETSSHSFQFQEYPQPALFEQVKYQGRTRNLSNFLSDRKTKTLAFIIIRNDTILFEHYWFGYDQTSIIPSFSLAKSFTAALIGIALDEGTIQSTHQPITDFLPQLKETDPRYAKITLQHLLDMRSGIQFDETTYGNPLAEISRLYYTKNIKKQVYSTPISTAPGMGFNYQSINAQLLGLTLEQATSTSPAVFLENKIWKPLGMEYSSSWSMDSKKHQTIKAYCCLNLRPRDLAKLGRLYLHQGTWNGKQVISSAWVKKSTTPLPRNFGYQNHWYSVKQKVTSYESVDGKKKSSKRLPSSITVTRYNHAFMATGHLGQFLYIHPQKKVIIVRMGKGLAKVNWVSLFNQIVEEL